MKYIKELREGENVIEHYLCKSRASMKSRNGKTYLSLKLQDKTGIVDAKVWDMNKDIQSFQENDFIKVDAFVTTFNNELQLNVKRIRRSREGEYDPADFIPSTDKNIDEMYTQLLAYIKTIQSPYIKKLLEEIFLRHPVISKDFKYHSAAKTMHHSFRGGLVEHTLSVTQICDFMAPRYEFVDRDILVACAMLHDVGKIMELSDFPENDYTDEGQLLGHIFIGAELIRDTAAENRGLSAKACHAADALHPFPPRRTGIWLSQGARNHRGLYFALRRQHGRKNEDVRGNACRRQHTRQLGRVSPYACQKYS